MLLLKCSGWFTSGRGQQAHSPSLVLQHVVPSGQLAVSLQGTSEYTEVTRNYRNRLRTSISEYSCVCVCWIQCFELPCVTATFWLIGWTGTFSSQGEEPEGSSHDPAATLQVFPWGQQWMKSSQHTAYREN